MSSLVLSGGFWSTVGDWIANIFITLGLLIDNVVYVFINWMYRVFMLVAKVDIFGGGAEIEAITKRIYIIVGVAMLFIFAYNLVLLIINPEGKQLGNMKKVIQNAIISIILITLLPLIFSYLTTIQNHILESNIIGQIILGTSTEEELENKNKKAGVKTSLDIFSAFYHPEGQSLNSCRSNPSANELCARYVDAYDLALQNDDISSFIWDDTLKAGLKEGTMEYTWIISTIAGVFALWCFVSFALDIGIRVGKMAFYEIISPVPVMMRILPNDKMFDKWFKGITNTYVSLFVRLAIIYFCVYAITLVPDILTNMWAASGDSGILVMLANVVVILGILKFAQEAPKLLSDLFGGSGNIKFGIGSKVRDNKLAMAGMGAVGSGAGGVASNVRKMFTKETDADGNEYTKFKFSNPLRGVGKGMYTGMREGAKAGTFEELGNAVEDGMKETAKKNVEYIAKRDKRLEKGEEVLGEDSTKFEKAIVGTALDIKDSVKEGVKEGIENVDSWLLGGSGSKTVRDAITSVSGKLDAMTKKYSGDNVEVAKKVAEDWRKKYLKGEKINIPNVGTFKQGDGKDFEKGLKKYTSEVKREAYKSKFSGKTRDNDAILKAYQDNIEEALKNTIPTLGQTFAEKMCDAYKKEFHASDGINVSVASILSELKNVNPSNDVYYGEKIEFVSNQLKEHGSLLEIQARQAKEKKQS